MQNWKISQRLMAGFGLVIAMLLGMSVYSVYIARGIDAALTANATQNAVIQRAAINFRGSAHDRSIAVRDVVLAPNEAVRQREIEAIDRLAAFYAASGQQMDKVLQSGGSVPPEVAPMVQAIRDIEARTVATTRKVVALVQAGDRTAAEALLWSDAKPQYEQWLAAINKLIDFEEARIIKNSTEANQEASQFSKVMLAITALALLVGVTATVLVSRSIGRELGAEPREVRSVVQAMQQGNLTVAVPVRPGDSSSVMVAVRDMQQRFHELVSAVRAYVGHERATLEAVAQLRAQAISLTSPAQLGVVESELEHALGTIEAPVEVFLRPGQVHLAVGLAMVGLLIDDEAFTARLDDGDVLLGFHRSDLDGDGGKNAG